MEAKSYELNDKTRRDRRQENEFEYDLPSVYRPSISHSSARNGRQTAPN